MEKGKSESLPARGRYIARCFDGGADRIKKEKAKVAL